MNNTQARRVDDSHNLEPDLIPTDPAIEGVEKLDDWLEHLETFVQGLCPFGALETLYAQRAALYLWRLNRIIGYEDAATLGDIESELKKKRQDSQESRVNREPPNQTSLQTIIKYEAHLVRCLSSTMAELRRLQKERRQGLRDVNPAERGADRAGICQNPENQDGSHGGSPSRQITGAEMLISGGRGADRAGICQNQENEDGSHGCSPSRQIPGAEMPIPGGRGADRAGICEKESVETGSHGGSPYRQITGAEMSISGGRGADRAGVCQNQENEDGSHGGSPSLKNSTPRKSSPTRKHSHSRKNSTRRSATRSQRASPTPMIPPLLDAISTRRRLCESIAGETFEFERNLTTASLDLSIGRCP